MFDVLVSDLGPEVAVYEQESAFVGSEPSLIYEDPLDILLLIEDEDSL